MAMHAVRLSIQLTYHASRGDLSDVAALLEQGADPDTRAANGKSALMAAAIGGHEAVVEYLLAKGAKATHRDDKGFSARDYAQQRGFTGIEWRLLRAEQAEQSQGAP